VLLPPFGLDEHSRLAQLRPRLFGRQ